jgi:hypothetical protein
LLGERLVTNTRVPVEERYSEHAGYVAAVGKAAAYFVALPTP